MYNLVKPKIIGIGIILISLGVLIASTVQAQTEVGKEYILGPGDIVEITVWDHDDLYRKLEISQEMAFTFPLIGKVYVDNLSIFELENTLKTRLADGYIVAPQVTANVVEYKNQKIFLFGEVKKPGSYVLKRKTHIVELISEVGGFTDNKGHTITIVRPVGRRPGSTPISLAEASENEKIELDLLKVIEGTTGDNYFIYPGDTIYISRVKLIFVTGEVANPGFYNWDNALTVRQAISLAGGPKRTGAVNRAMIIRIENDKEKKIKPKMSDKLEPGDIVKIPVSYF
jgi:polysaccharide export outer membrane protein